MFITVDCVDVGCTNSEQNIEIFLFYPTKKGIHMGAVCAGEEAMFHYYIGNRCGGVM